MCGSLPVACIPKKLLAALAVSASLYLKLPVSAVATVKIKSSLRLASKESGLYVDFTSLIFF